MKTLDRVESVPHWEDGCGHGPGEFQGSVETPGGWVDLYQHAETGTVMCARWGPELHQYTSLSQETVLRAIAREVV